jgi:hypothetical protein
MASTMLCLLSDVCARIPLLFTLLRISSVSDLGAPSLTAFDQYFTSGAVGDTIMIQSVLSLMSHGVLVGKVVIITINSSALMMVICD